MAAKTSNIYQFKITLKEVKPTIWRRIQVPENYNFANLHSAIKNAMGWAGYHLHQFHIKNPATGKKDWITGPEVEPFDDEDQILENETKIAKYFVSPKDKAIYEYDFGDGWMHEIVLEKILPAVNGITYPKCVTGKRACPPEDCGGAGGYEELLQIRTDPKNKEDEERIEWYDVGNDFNPEAFDPKLVWFSSDDED